MTHHDHDHHPTLDLVGFLDEDAQSTGHSTVADPHVDVELGCAVQINNVYAIDASASKFCAELVINLTWIDPGLEEALGDGSLREELAAAGQWKSFQPGWLFKDLESPVFADTAKHKSAFVLQTVLENKAELTWLNEVESITVKYDPIYLVDRKGRVAYAITVKSAFDEVMELHTFPFDKQVFDVRFYFEPTDNHNWSCVPHPFEINGWYGKWTKDANGDIIEHPEWVMSKYVDDHVDTFTSESSGSSWSRYTIRIVATRKSAYFVTNLMGIVFVVVLLGAGVPAMPVVEYADRYANLLTLFLTLVAFKLVVADTLPKVTYLTVLDRFMLMGFFILFATAIESMTLFMMYKDDPVADDHDLIFQAIYAGIWVLYPIWIAFNSTINDAKWQSEQIEETGWVVLDSGEKLLANGDDEPRKVPYRSLPITNSPQQISILK